MPKSVQEFNFTKLPKLPKMKVEQLVGGEFVIRYENARDGKSHIATSIGPLVIMPNRGVRRCYYYNDRKELLEHFLSGKG